MNLRITPIIVLALLIIAPAALADTPRSPAARKALAIAQQETRKAEQEHRQRLIGIQQALIRDLESAKAEAMQSQLLDEANAIQAAIDEARAELDRLEGKPQVSRFEIDSTKDWQPTVELTKGAAVSIEAAGSWCADIREPEKWTCGPGGMMHANRGIRAFYLEGRINGSKPFPVGATAAFRSPADGLLELRMMETGGRKDNSGKVTAAIRH